MDNLVQSGSWDTRGIKETRETLILVSLYPLLACRENDYIINLLSNHKVCVFTWFQTLWAPDQDVLKSYSNDMIWDWNIVPRFCHYLLNLIEKNHNNRVTLCNLNKYINILFHRVFVVVEKFEKQKFIDLLAFKAIIL